MHYIFCHMRAFEHIKLQYLSWSMKQLGAMYQGQRTCLSKMYTTTEESDFMAQLLGGLNSVPNDLKPTSKNVARNIIERCSLVSNSVNPDESTSSFLTHGTGIFVDGYDQEGLNDHAFGAGSSLFVASDCRMSDIRTMKNKLGDKHITSDKKPGKKSHNSADVKNKRNAKPRKTQRAESSSEADEDVTWGIKSSQGSSLIYIENESSSSHKNEPALNINGRTRAGRGSATDPQSLYARKRRERINERLKTLQGLVPNGTKVDISTMLEEAVQYVKFLQLQIKLLSSDDLWMYAPLAYDGMDIGLSDTKDRTE